MLPFSIVEFQELPLAIKSLDMHENSLILSDVRGMHKFQWENKKFNQTDFNASSAGKLLWIAGKLLALVDTNISFWDNNFRPLFIKSIRGVSLLEKDNDGLGFSTIDRNNQLINWKIHGKNLMNEQVFPIDGGAIVMKRYGQHVCMADLGMYKLINCSNGKMITLFPYDRHLIIPLISLINDQFLLTCDGQNKTLGIFMTVMGHPTKGTLEWPCNVTSLVFSYPWIISSLVTNQVHIHNYANQELVQILDLPYNSRELRLFNADCGIQMDNSNVLNVLCVGHGTYGLVMKDLELLLSELVDSKQVTKAISLAETLWDHSLSSKKLNQLYTIGAETLLHETYFQESFEMYSRAKVEPTVVISFFPEFNIDSKVSIPNIVDNFLSSKYPNILKYELESFKIGLLDVAYKELIKYLLEYKNSNTNNLYVNEIDCALLKLYIKNDQERLYKLLQEPHSCDLDICEQACLQNNKIYGLSLLYKSHNLLDRALDLWVKLDSGELTDPAFPGSFIIVDFFDSINDPELILKYMSLLLGKHEKLALAIFKQKKDLFSIKQILEHLKRYSATAYTSYLEYIIFDLKYQDENYHTDLALTYINSIVKLQESTLPFIEEYKKLDNSVSFETFLENHSTPFSVLKLKLIRFLFKSQHLDVTRILNKCVNKSEWVLELCAIDFTRNHHLEAISRLINFLLDVSGAEDYILKIPNSCRSQALCHLLKMILDISINNQVDYSGKILEIIQRHILEFDIFTIMDVIPPKTSVCKLNQIFTSFFRSQIHSFHMHQMHQSLLKVRRLNVSLTRIIVDGKPKERIFLDCTAHKNDIILNVCIMQEEPRSV